MAKSRSKPGVYLRGRVWWIRYTDHHGKQIRKSASTDQSVAIKLLGDALEAVEKMRGGMVTADPLQTRRPITEHVTEYVANLARLGRDAMYRYTVEKRLSMAIKAQHWSRLSDCTPASVTGYLADLGKADEGKKGRTPKTINDHRADLSAFFAWCVKQGRMEANPCALIEKTADQRDKGRRALSVPEIKALLAATPEPRRLVYLFLVYTGLRRAEAAALRWGHLHLDSVNRYVELPASVTKSGRPETVPLVDAVADALTTARGEAGDGEPVFAEIPEMPAFRADLAAAEIEEVDERGRVVVLHSLRHSLATMLAASGVPMPVAQRIMRHRDIRLTAEVYTDEGLLPLAAGIKALPSLIDGPSPEAGALATTGTDAVAPIPDCAKSVLDGRHCAAQSGTPVRVGPESARDFSDSGETKPTLALGGQTPRLGLEPRT
jgi:integrase